MIIGGTSLALYPAAGLLQYFRGDAVAQINRDRTPYDARATLSLHESIGKVPGRDPRIKIDHGSSMTYASSGERSR